MNLKMVSFRRFSSLCLELLPCLFLFALSYTNDPYNDFHLVQNQLLDLKDQNLDFNNLNDQVSEKNALIDELNVFIIQLKSQLEEMSSRPNQYADLWIQGR